MSYLSNNTYSVTLDMPYEQSYIMSQGLTKSLCLRHPIYGECPLAFKSHECDACENCKVYGRGDCEDPLTYEKPKAPVYHKPGEHVCNHDGCSRMTTMEYCIKHRKFHVPKCAFPGCTNHVMIKIKSDYCALCHNVLKDRKKKWEAKNDGPIPHDVLYRPKDKKMSARGKLSAGCKK
jgi:hypothetical protein